MPCFSCGAAIPDEARFCPSCGSPAGSDAMTMGATDPATRVLPPGASAGVTRGPLNMLLLIAIVVGLTSWGFYTSVAGRLWKIEAAGG